MTWDTELDMMLAAAKGSADVTLNGVTVRGIVDEYDQVAHESMGPGSIGTIRSVLVKTGALPGLATGVTLTVGGIARKVRRRAKVDDGALTVIELENVASGGGGGSTEAGF